MSKLSIDALKERAAAFLNLISGGTENSCHCEEFLKKPTITNFNT